MIKRIIGAVLALTLILSVLCVGAAGGAAAENTAVITAGGKTYTFAVGEYFRYNLSFSYVGQRIATAQAELPVDFGGLGGYTQSELGSFASQIAPVSGENSVILRSDSKKELELVGYVMNFAYPVGYSFVNGKTVLSLLFSVKKAGSYTLAAKVRYVDDRDGNAVVDGKYNILSSKFSISESVEPAEIDTPKLSVATAAGGMKVSWNAVAGASVYRVFYKGSKGWTRLKDTKETSVLDTDVKGGYRYTYTVRCVSSDGSRYISDYDRDGESAVYYPAPKLSLSCGEDEVKIKWDAESGASKYRVYVKGTDGWTRLTDTAATSCTDKNVISGKKYTYTIRTLDSGGNLLSSYYADGFSIGFIAAPSFSVSNAADGVKIEWNKVGGAAKYRVFYKGRNGWTRLVDTAATSVVDKDVLSNYNYTYTVRCISADGSAYTSDYRAGKSVRYFEAPKLTLSNVEDGVSIKWNAVAGVSKYRVYYKGRNGWTKLTDTSGTSFIDTDVASGYNYTYTIRCMDANGNHISYYYTDGFKIKFLRAPSFSLSNAPDGVNISWGKVNGAVRYRVYYYGSKGWTWLCETTDTSVIDKDVYSNHNYTYTVRCISEDGKTFTSDYRAGKKIKYFEAPKATLTNTSSGVNIKWNAVAGVAKYRVYVKSPDGWTRITETSGTSHLDKNVRSGSSYTYTVRCLDSNGNFISDFYREGFTIKATPHNSGVRIAK